MAPRKRAPSVQQTIHNIEVDRTHHLTGPFQPPTPLEARTPRKPKVHAPSEDPFYATRGLWDDIKTLRWMRVPSSAFKLMMIPIVLFCITKVALPNGPNPFEPMLFISHEVPNSSKGDSRYAKGPMDIMFIAYHIIAFSFIRQFTLFNIIHPLGLWLGLKRGLKLERFGEQAYAVLYYGTMGFWGIFIMKELPTWWYDTKYYWIDYPHWEMLPNLKRYYLMHFSYWLQQLLILSLKLEKPRSDFKELVVHHIVTIWLIGWSYGINLTLIGNAVFVSMDIPDVFLALSKICNYLKYDTTKAFTFVNFFVIWTYFRHWLNLRIMWSVWTEFELVPASTRLFSPWDGVWMANWMRYQIFIPILLLQFLNLFWYYLMCRILYRAVFGGEISDDRSDDEDDGKDD
ncbi:longevity assurance proteins LAG1/LAC1 [Schizopora paradoxa]|uniref:Longevity assurance proteins LAG1/LAC1 n=1 Tax=Schizopora paradoxa TaxID=27342 RepID=A0A0H2R8V5_9AGAM|nr:longevity assurance proteins LAG1/LAC1 [Schizopora paradoxa]